MRSRVSDTFMQGYDSMQLWDFQLPSLEIIWVFDLRFRSDWQTGFNNSLGGIPWSEKQKQTDLQTRSADSFSFRWRIGFIFTSCQKNLVWKQTKLLKTGKKYILENNVFPQHD